MKSHPLNSKLSYVLVFSFLLAALSNLAYGQVINYRTRIEIADDGRKTTKKTVLIQINNKQENWPSHIELSHSPNQEFKLEYGQILDLEGNVVRKLKKKDLVTRNDLSYQTFYQDDLITEFKLYWNEYPYRIEYSYSLVEEEYLFLAWWVPIYYIGVPTMDASLEVDLPSDYPIQISATGELDLNESSFNGRKVLRWKSGMVRSRLVKDVYSPPLTFPYVKIIPEEFTYGVIGASKSWSSFGNWLDRLNEGTDQLTLQEKETVARLIGSARTKEETISTLYHYLQDQTTYINVAIDVGGLKSYPATYVCKNKYGDCKALTTYMKAMLKSAGIESYYTIVKSGEEINEIDQDFPSQQFDHVILMVPTETDTVWLENTSSSLPFNYLGTFTQNRYALAVGSENSQLVKTPELSIDDVLIERRYQFVADDNQVRVDLDLVLRGQVFEDFRYLIAENKEDRQRDEIIRHHGIQDIQIYEWKIIDFHRDSTFLQLNIQGVWSSGVRQIGPLKVIRPPGIPLPDFELPQERETDVCLNFPINRSDESVYELKNQELMSLQIPEDIIIQNEFGSYTVGYTLIGSKVKVNEHFTLQAGRIPLEKYGEFYSFISAIVAYKKKAAILIK